MKELKRASDIVSQIQFGKKKTWKDLFEKHSFFTEDYKYYLSVNCASRSKEAQQVWSGHVQSKVRRLVSAIENSDTGVAIAHPYVKGFSRVHRCKTEDEVDNILHGELKYQIDTTTEETTGIAAVLAGEDNDQAAAGVSESEDSEKHDKMNTPELDAEKNMIIYTTTYYVGLELGNEGDRMCPSKF